MERRQHEECFSLSTSRWVRNAPPALLYEEALCRQEGAVLASSGALLVCVTAPPREGSGGPQLVEQPGGQAGSVPRASALEAHSFLLKRQRAIDYLNLQERLYVCDAFACWDSDYRLRVRMISDQPYHALFMHNLLIRPRPEELGGFEDPELVIYNAGEFPADPHATQADVSASVDLSLEHGELVILGTERACEMKRGLFTLLHYLMPKQGVLPLRCAANVGPVGEVTLFLGRGGAGKTTLATSAQHALIGDDEHGWSETGIFNFEAGSYPRVLHLSATREPAIARAIRFGTLLEQVGYDRQTREVDYTDGSAERSRALFPLEHLPQAKLSGCGEHPRYVILLVCDPFAVLPPVSLLRPEQALYHFLSGYRGYEGRNAQGAPTPQVSFSPCCAGPWLVWEPGVYVEMLADRLRRHSPQLWLINTGWSGGPLGHGARLSLEHARALVTAIQAGTLGASPFLEEPVFGLRVPRECPGVPAELLVPWERWPTKEAYQRAAEELAARFRENFRRWEGMVSPAVREGGPRLIPR